MLKANISLLLHKTEGFWFCFLHGTSVLEWSQMKTSAGVNYEEVNFKMNTFMLYSSLNP